jgi:hypothetical protein
VTVPSEGISYPANVNVANGAVLTGTGTLSAIETLSVASGGIVSPGTTGTLGGINNGGVYTGADVSQIGTLTVNGTATFASGAKLQLDLKKPDTTTGTNPSNELNDQIGGTVQLTLATTSNFVLNLAPGYTPQLNDLFFITTGAINTTAVTGLGNGTVFTNAGTPGVTWEAFTAANYANNSISGGTDLAIQVVPEPNAISMLAGSFGLALGLQRFRRRRK